MAGRLEHLERNRANRDQLSRFESIRANAALGIGGAHVATSPLSQYRGAFGMIKMPVRQYDRDQARLGCGQDCLDVRLDGGAVGCVADHPGVGSIQGHRTWVGSAYQLDVGRTWTRSRCHDDLSLAGAVG